MSHQIPPAHPIAHANAANQQQPFLYGYPQGLVPLAYPPGLPPPPFAHPYPNSHSQFTQPPPPMPNSYGQYPTFGFPVVPSALDPVQTSALRSKDRPNRQIRPGGMVISTLSTESYLPLSQCAVFAFQVDVLDGEQRETFQTDTEVSWGEFRGRIVRSLGDPEKVQLSGKIVGDGRWGVLNGDEGLEEVLRRICQKATNARTKPVALEVKNMVVSYFLIFKMKSTHSPTYDRHDLHPKRVKLWGNAHARTTYHQSWNLTTTRHHSIMLTSSLKRPPAAKATRAIASSLERAVLTITIASRTRR